MAATTDHQIDAITTDDAVRAVLHETLDLLRAALAGVLGDDNADDYGLGADPPR